MSKICKSNPIVAAVCIVALIFTFVSPLPALAQSPGQHGWESVQALDAGSTVVVKTYDNKTLHARVVKVDQAAISIETKHGTQAIPKEEIQSLELVKGSGKRGLGIALVIAGSAAFVAGIYKIVDDTTNCVNQIEDNGSNCANSTDTSNAAWDVAAYGGLGVVAGGVIMMGRGGRGGSRTIYWTDGPPSSAHY